MPAPIDAQRFRGVLLRSFIWSMITKGVTYAELAIFLHISRSTVSGLLYRAKLDKVSRNDLKVAEILTPEEYTSFFGNPKRRGSRPGPKPNPTAIPNVPSKHPNIAKYFDDDDWDYTPPVPPIKPAVDKTVKKVAVKPQLSVAVVKRRNRIVDENTVYAPQLRELFPYPPEPAHRPKARVPHSTVYDDDDDEIDGGGHAMPKEFDYQKAIEPKGSSSAEPPHFVCMNASEISDKVCQVVVGHDGTTVNGRYVPLYCGHPRVPDLKFMFCHYHASYMLVQSGYRLTNTYTKFKPGRK